MDQSAFEKSLTLLIIKNVPKFRNSYDLTKVLAWKFGIIEFVDLTQSLEKDNLISGNLKEGIRHYNITEKGENYLKENYSILHSETMNKYPEQSEFINTIFKQSDTRQ
jgi:DNA-binding PadR family transcriptional regulator